MGTPRSRHSVAEEPVLGRLPDVSLPKCVQSWQTPICRRAPLVASGQHLGQGATHRSSPCRVERIYGAHQNFERIARKRFFALARQSQTYASPVRLAWLSDQVPTRFKRLNGLCCGAARCRLKFREGRRGPRERVGTREEAERHPLGRTEFAVIALSLYEPSHLQQELCRFARRHVCLFDT